MPEGMNQNAGSKEQKRSEQEREYVEHFAGHFAIHPEQLKVAETLREAGPEIAEFEAMIASFESTHSLEKLHSIVDLSPNLAELFKRADDLEDPERIEKEIARYEKHNPKFIPEYKKIIAAARAIVLSPEDQKKFEIRRSAKKDLAPVAAKLDMLKKETNISDEKHTQLKGEYKRLAKALGSINNIKDKNKVDHS